MIKEIFVGILVLIGLFILGWIFAGNEFFLYKFFAPKKAEVERQVFENTRSFTQGMVQELENMMFDYIKEDNEEAKSALRDIILHRASGFNLNDPDVSYELKSFISNLK